MSGIVCRPRLLRAALLSCLLAGPVVQAQMVADREEYSARFQATYNWQQHGAFRSSYAGPYSLLGGGDKMYTFSATAHLGFRPWAGGEIYFNPEVVQGMPFTGNLVGLGGFTNGEATRAGGPNPTFYRQRLFLRQTWNQGGGSEAIGGEANQLAGSVDRHRTVLTVGNFSTLDVFDDNRYAKDPRTQFMNWSHWTYGAFDYAADARGFGWGAALEWYRGDWVFRAGRMSSPRVPNGLEIDPALGSHFGDQIEIEKAHVIGGQPGRVRVLAWRNRAVLASFQDALAWLKANPGVYNDPSALIASRKGEKIKYGLGVNVEQALGKDLGVFLRVMQADGRTETHAFTEIDASLSVGLQQTGQRWGRPDDSWGLALARNHLSTDRRRFLEAGGISFFIGDGALRYRPETILEVYYSLRVHKAMWMTLDWQRIDNPAYNADRGPLNVFAVRLHAEF